MDPARLSESVIVGKNAPSAIRIVAGTREWRRPAASSRAAPGSDATRFTTIATGAMQQVEQELVARLVGVQRVRQHAALGHEHVGREHGAQEQRQRAGDVHDRREQPQVAGHRVADRLAGRRVDGVARAPAAAASATISTIERIVTPTTAPAANRGQVSFWKYVSTPIARARITAPDRGTGAGSGPAPA